MAIVIEEDKKKAGSPLAAFGWMTVIVILAIGAYYLFFAAPPPAVVTPPPGYVALQPISQITVTPQDVAGSAVFAALQPATPQAPTSTVPIGRTNPFLSP